MRLINPSRKVEFKRNRQPNERLAISKFNHRIIMTESSRRFTEVKYSVKRAPNFTDLTGRKFKYLTVIGFFKVPNKPKSIYWNCECKCGVKTIAITNHLIHGLKQSCGCLRSERENLTGQTFNRILIIDRAPDKFVPSFKYPLTSWRCLCHCGKEFTNVGSRIKRGLVKSCGCGWLASVRTHGESHNFRSPEFVAWTGMKQRCLNSKTRHYNIYGGRGIKVCERWMKFENLLEDMGRKPTPKHSIERKDRNGNYDPINCKWGTVEEQQNNKINNVLIRFNGETLSLAQWARKIGVSPCTIAYRINAGWTIEKAVTQTPNPTKQRFKK